MLSQTNSEEYQPQSFNVYYIYRDQSLQILQYLWFLSFPAYFGLPKYSSSDYLPLPLPEPRGEGSFLALHCEKSHAPGGKTHKSPGVILSFQFFNYLSNLPCKCSYQFMVLAGKQISVVTLRICLSLQISRREFALLHKFFNGSQKIH